MSTQESTQYTAKIFKLSFEEFGLETRGLTVRESAPVLAGVIFSHFSS